MENSNSPQDGAKPGKPKIIAIPTDPPPIIIKSGSFDFESRQNVTESGGTGGNPFIYRWDGFGEIQGVRVYVTNENEDKADCREFEDEDGIEVEIQLQEFRMAGGWQDINPPVTIRTVAGSGNANDFEMRIGKRLERRGHPKPGRNEKRRSRDAENLFRIGSVTVRENGGGGDTFDDEGDDYIITLYNELD